MRKLHNLTAFPIDNLDETGACGQHHLYGIRLKQAFVNEGATVASNSITTQRSHEAGDLSWHLTDDSKLLWCAAHAGLFFSSCLRSLHIASSLTLSPTLKLSPRHIHTTCDRPRPENAGYKRQNSVGVGMRLFNIIRRAKRKRKEKYHV